MDYFGHYNDKGEYIGFYTEEIHGHTIPKPVIVLQHNEWQEAISGEYTVINGKHVKRIEPRKEVLDIHILRIRRNTKLVDSDWTQLPDVPLLEEKKEEWREYRQKLRDITKPENISSEFPIEP